MTALGQKQRSRDVRVTSALPLKGDIHRKVRHFSKVPEADMKAKLSLAWKKLRRP